MLHNEVENYGFFEKHHIKNHCYFANTIYKKAKI